MIDLVGWFGLLAGGALFYQSARLVSQANAGRRVPYWSSPVVTPRPAFWMRGAGVLLAALSTSLLASTLGFWTVAVILAALLSGLATIPIHNRRLTTGNPA
ncbi:hypothetical protein ACFT30_10410 [Microbacterium ureisolvens]|uniref:hypothetical protein n=1 Tax=Microbacterium ureisolvens TaxID=2781186 RepID=UPI003626E441